MADLLRRMSVLRGLDPREFSGFAYGGMGPVHAAAVAREVGMKRLVIPLLHVAPVWSAFGATVADVVHVHQRPLRFLLPVDGERLAETFAGLEDDGREVLRSEGFEGDRVELRRSLRMRYATQVFDIEVPLAPGSPLAGDAITAAFEETYEALHGADSGHPEGGIEIMSFIVRARGVTDPPELVAPGQAAEAAWSSRPVLLVRAGRLHRHARTAAGGRHRVRPPRGPAAHRVARHGRRTPAGPDGTLRDLGSLVVEI